MNFIKMLIGLPLIAVVLVFAFVNNDLVEFDLWPFYIEITVSLSVAIVFFVLFGFVFGWLFTWMSYAPVRKALRQQKKQNKKLNKEQEKLVKEMQGLHEDIETLKADEAKAPKMSFKEKFKNFFAKKKQDN